MENLLELAIIFSFSIGLPSVLWYLKNRQKLRIEEKQADQALEATKIRRLELELEKAEQDRKRLEEE